MITFSPSTYTLPAISLVATPTKRQAILELAVEAERRGFAGIACPSLGGTLGLCVSLAHATSTIPFWTSIQPMYYSHPVELGNTAAHIHEISAGRFGLGIGVSHGPVVQRLGVATGKPLSDISTYVQAMRSNERFSGQLPQIFLATLRDKMLALSTEISQGAIWANASLRDISRQVASVAPTTRDQFFMSNMVPTVISTPHNDVRKLLRQAKYPQALLLVNKGLANNPRDPQMRFWQAFIFEQLGQADMALQAYLDLTREYPELAEPFNNLGVIYASKGDYPNAKAALDNALRANPKYAAAHENMGDLLVNMARQSYEQSLLVEAKQRGIAQKIERLKPVLELTQDKP